MPDNKSLDAHYLMLDALPDAQDISAEAQIGESCRVTGNVRIGAGTIVENCIIRGPVVIGCNCRIKDAYVGSYTELGDNVEFVASEIEHARVEDNVVIRSLGGRIQDSNIGKNSKIIRQTEPASFFHFSISENALIEII